MNPLATTIVRGLNKAAFKAQKHLPEFLLVGGVIGTVASTVLACKATVKAQPVLDNAKKQLDMIHDSEDVPGYSKEQKTRDLTAVYVSTGKELAKIYGPSAALGFASMSCLVGSNVIVRQRLTAAVAAYTALGESFRKYRDQVEGQLGVKALPEVSSSESDGSHTIEIEQPIPSYRFIFDKNNPNWKDNVDYNLMTLKSCQRYLDCELVRKGHLFVNDFCNELDYEETPNGQLDGWIYDSKNADGYRDGCVSFGLVDKNGNESENLRAYKAGEVDYIVINLNIDGTIIDRI